MNIKTLAKELNQKYIRDIDSAAGKVGPYYFIVEPASLVGLIRVTFSVKSAEAYLQEFQETMAHFRAIGRDGVRITNHQLILECKVNGLEHSEDFARILESIGNTLHDHNIPQVDFQGKESDNLGVFRVGTKLEVQTDDTIQEVSSTIKKQYNRTNQSRSKGFILGFGWFLLLSPLYIIVKAFEPSIFGFVIFSFMVLIAILKKSLSMVYRYWSPSKTDLLFLLAGYIGLMFVITFASILGDTLFRAIVTGEYLWLKLTFQLAKSNAGDIFYSSVKTLAFAIAFNYHIVRSLIDGASSGPKPVKRTINRVL